MVKKLIRDNGDNSTYTPFVTSDGAPGMAYKVVNQQATLSYGSSGTNLQENYRYTYRSAYGEVGEDEASFIERMKEQHGGTSPTTIVRVALPKERMIDGYPAFSHETVEVPDSVLAKVEAFDLDAPTMVQPEALLDAGWEVPADSDLEALIKGEHPEQQQDEDVASKKEA